MPTTVNMFWHDGPLPPFAWACMQSFIDHGHAIRLFTYHRIEAPRGVINADAGTVVGFDQVGRYRSVTAFSDIFRYELLLKDGGWWIDTDVVCLTDRLPETTHAWAEEEPGVINGAILKFPKGDPVVAQLATKVRELADRVVPWGATGPHLASQILRSCHPAQRAGSTSTFYPLHWLEAPRLLLPEHAADIVCQIEGASFVHLWAGAFKDVGVDLNHQPPRGSFIHGLLKAHSFEVKATWWTEFMMRRAIRRYWRQSWAADHWSKIRAADATKRELKADFLR